jgi:pimeloyl-ACP methyl ester carboxylesterase
MDGTDSDDSHLGADAQMDRLRAQARTHVTGAPGQQITWAEWGPADAPVLVMLHGAYGSWPHFVRNIEAFASTNRILVPDQPGFGASDLPKDLSIAAVGRAVAQGLDDLIGRDTRYRVFGFSFGGSTGGRLMAEHRDRISHALLVAPAGISRGAKPDMRGVRNRRGTDLRDALAFNLRSIMFARDDSVTPQSIAVQHLGSSAARLRVERLDWGPGMRDVLVDFPGHVSLAWGRQDAFIPEGETPDRAQIVTGWNPQADTHWLENTGHWAPYEAADEVNAILQDLLSRPDRA